MKVDKPWGYYETIKEESNFLLKKIVVNPGKRLSLQKHKKRTENWVIIEGNALVTLKDKCFNVNKNDEIFIPKETAHRIECTSKIPLIFIEVQQGDSFDENDIIRLEDDYGRAN